MSRLTLALSLSLGPALYADNGATARAFPTEGIRADGDLSDWPEDAELYPIALEQKDNVSNGPADLSAGFRVAYDSVEERIFVAVEVVDQEHITERPGEDWDQWDGCIVYLDGEHSPKGSGAIGFATSGTVRDIVSSQGAWDPKVAAGNWHDSSCAMRRNGTRTVYEFVLKASELPYPGRTIGLDIGVLDRDEADGYDGGTYVTWGRFSAKSGRSGRLGDVLLLESEDDTGTLRGTTRWADAVRNAPGYLDRVRIRSLEAPELWLQVATQETSPMESSFEIGLPPGEYEVSCPFATWGPETGPHLIIAEDVTVRTSVQLGRISEAPCLELRTVEPPALFTGKGVLFDYADDDEDALDAFIEAYRTYFRIPGLSVALVKDRELAYHKTFGVKNAFTDEPVDDSTLFEGCSMTKTVFAFAVNRMAERGEIDLDKPLHEYLPFEDIAHDERYKRITARHVLTHRSGFPNWRWQNDDGELDIKFEPGTAFGYSGEGFEYLGRVTAKIRSQSLAEILYEDVQVPMGLTENIFFAANPALARVVAHGHDNERPFIAQPPESIGVAHSMHTEARAFSSFLIALLERRGLSGAGYDEMLRLQSRQEPFESSYGVPWPRGYGLGFSLQESPHGLAFGHGGSNGDFHCLFEAYPEHGAGFVAFGNSERSWAFTEVLRRYLTVGALTEAPESREALRR